MSDFFADQITLRKGHGQWSWRTTSKDMFRTQEDTEVTSAKRPSTGVNNICKSENRDLSELSSKIVDTCDAARHV